MVIGSLPLMWCSVWLWGIFWLAWRCMASHGIAARGFVWLRMALADFGASRPLRSLGAAVVHLSATV